MNASSKYNSDQEKLEKSLIIMCFMIFAFIGYLLTRFL